MTTGLENIVEGDSIIVYSGSNSDGRITKVTEITAAGFIKTEHYIFYRNGRRRGGEKSMRINAEAITKERVEKIKRTEMINFIRYYNLQKLSFEQAKEIKRILEIAP
jgi:hypothetical protein